MFNDNFVPTPPRHFGRSKGVKSAYMAKYNSGFNFRGLMFDYAVKDNSRSLMVVIPIRLDLPSYQIHHICLELCLDLELELELLLLQILKELLMMHGILIVVLLTTLPTWLINMQIREEFRGKDQLIVRNGQGLSIIHIGDASLYFKGSLQYQNHIQIALKDIMLVPSITKNLLSISKLTTNNNLVTEFLGNVSFVKDKMRGHVLL